MNDQWKPLAPRLKPGECVKLLEGSGCTPPFKEKTWRVAKVSQASALLVGKRVKGDFEAQEVGSVQTDDEGNLTSVKKKVKGFESTVSTTISPYSSVERVPCEDK